MKKRKRRKFILGKVMGKIESESYEKIQPIERQRLYAFWVY